MYYYIVNPSAGDGRIESLQTRLKARLRQLGIDGEFAKTLGKKDSARLTRTALQQNSGTIVAVGGDKTVNEVIAAVHASERPQTPIGIIPIGTNNHLAGLLRLGTWQQATELLAARRLHSFRLITLNRHLFLHQAAFHHQNETVRSSELLAEIDKKYKLRANITGCTLSNLRFHNPHLPDGLFLQIIGELPKKSWWRKPTPANTSQLHGRTLTLEFAEPATATIDGRRIADTTYRLSLSPTPIRLITNQLRGTTEV